MEFKDITTWSVSKGVATPVNPYSIPEMVIGGEIEQQLAKSRARILKLKFESIKLQHTFATNAANFNHIASTETINGSLYTEIKRVMEAYASQFKNTDVVKVITDRIVELEKSNPYETCNKFVGIQELKHVLKLIQP